MAVPEKPTLDGLEATWDARWQEQGTYRFDRTRPREQVYAIDTPPPTVSGALHLGTAFGYIQVDAIARFQRMRGREVFYPLGWDDNGLPTERRVQNTYGVRCDPSLPYEPDLEITPTSTKGGDLRAVSRPNFLELCHRLTAEYEHDFERQWRSLGLSVDWSLTYATIDDRSRRAAQRAFLHGLARGEVYASEAPTMWDVDFRTAVAQAELEDRPVRGAYHRLRFAGREEGPDLEVETTRPELLPSCVALVAHPDDERWAPAVGTRVLTPVFGVEVPVLAHRLADPAKGSGLVMVCTFGDTTDVQWWRDLRLPTRSVLRRDGRFQEETPAWLEGAGARAWSALKGRTATQARRAVVELLRETGALVGEPRPVVHDVKFYEKGERPLEIVTSRQWYVRNGAEDETLRAALLARGRALDWHPDFMRRRYEHWVEGLATDWLISRQRYFGVPFPVWYPLDEQGEPDRAAPLLAPEHWLPVDPQADVPDGYTESQRDVPGGFTADPDVMDTWATSSLTPQIAGGWVDDEDLFARVFPYDLRPQGPEIIRTWLFATVLRSHQEHGVLPWAHATINGWILDPDRKKMSKSTGNTLEPGDFVARFGADGFRYWSCRSGLGVDTAVDEGQMRVGRRLATKLLNVARFVLGLHEAGVTGVGPVTAVNEPLDRSLLEGLARIAADATAAFEAYEFQRALDVVETFFWTFCDDYVELVKDRAYEGGRGADSAKAALALAQDALLRLLAPVLPFVTAEVWSWWRPGSVHRAPWPAPQEFQQEASGPEILDAARAVLAEIRKAKSQARRSQRSAVDEVRVTDTEERLGALRAGAADLMRAGSVRDLVLEVGEPAVTVRLAQAPA